MSDERLRLVAEVADQFTGPLDKLNTKLRRTAEAGSTAGKAMKKDFDGFGDSLAKAEGKLNGFLAPLSKMSGLGLTASLSIGGVAAAINSWAKDTQALGRAARDASVGVDTLRKYEALGKEFGVSAEAMRGGVKVFSDNLYDIQKRWGEAYSTLRNMNLGNIVEDMVSAKSVDQAMERAFKDIQAIPDIKVRQRVSALLFGTEDVSSIVSSLGKPVEQALKEIQNRIGALSKQNQADADQMVKDLARIGEAYDNLKNKVVGGAARGILGGIDDVRKNGLRGNESEQDLRNQLSPFGGADPSARQKLEGRSSSIMRQIELLDSNPNAADYARKRDRMVEELKRVADELQKLREHGNATVQQQSFNGAPGGGSLIQKAAFGVGGIGFPGAIPPMGAPGGRGGSTTGSGAASRGGGGGDAGQFTAAPPEAAGKYRPQRKLTDRDLSDAVVNTIAGEARLRSKGGADAVINNMFNRLGSKGWGPSRDLQDVARAPGQYAGYRRATEAEANYIRERIRAIASGGVPDNTGGSNSFRTSTYRGPWWQRHGRFGKDIAGNTFGYDPSVKNGPYAPYTTPRETAEGSGAPSGGGPVGMDGQAGTDLGNGTMRMPNGHIRSILPGSTGGGSGAGDKVMRRFYGNAAPDGPRYQTGASKGSLDIHLHGFPAGTRPRASMDDLFREVSISKSRQIEQTSL